VRHLRPILDKTTARNIDTALIYSKIDYYNSLFINLPANQLARLQIVPNSAARAVTNTPKFHHITPIQKSLHWLQISKCTHYKILSITYKRLLSDKPAHLRNLLAVQSTSTTRFSSVITLQRPYKPSSLKVSDRSFTLLQLYGTPCQKNYANTHPFPPKLNLGVSNYCLLNFTRNL
jgi:hypothetical protein